MDDVGQKIRIAIKKSNKLARQDRINIKIKNLKERKSDREKALLI